MGASSFLYFTLGFNFLSRLPSSFSLSLSFCLSLPLSSILFACLCCFASCYGRAWVWPRPPGRLDSPFLRQQSQHSPSNSSPNPPPRGVSPLRTPPHTRTQLAAAKAGRYRTSATSRPFTCTRLDGTKMK